MSHPVPTPVREPANRASLTTAFKLGMLTAEVQLFKCAGDGSLPEFEKAAPEGVKLVSGTVEVPVLVATPDDAPVPVVEDPEKLAELDERAEKHEGIAAGIREERAKLTPPAKTEPKRALLREDNREEVKPEQIRRGLRGADGQWVDLTDALAKADEVTEDEEMRVVTFVRTEQVGRMQVLGSYYLGVESPANARVLRLLYESLRMTHRVAVVKWTKRTRQALGVIMPLPKMGGVLGVCELAWTEDMRVPGGRSLNIQRAEVTREEVDAAVELVQAMSDSVSTIDQLRDDRRRLYEEVAAAAEAGEEPVIETVPQTAEEGDILATLRASAARADEFVSVA